MAVVEFRTAVVAVVELRTVPISDLSKNVGKAVTYFGKVTIGRKVVIFLRTVVFFIGNLVVILFVVILAVDFRGALVVVLFVAFLVVDSVDFCAALVVLFVAFVVVDFVTFLVVLFVPFFVADFVAIVVVDFG